MALSYDGDSPPVIREPAQLPTAGSHAHIDASTSNSMPKVAARRTTKSKLRAIPPDAPDAEKARLLKGKLLDWREVAGAKKFAPSIFRRLGGKLLLTEGLIDRLVLCARHHKINKVEDIARQTGWRNEFAVEFSGEIFEIIRGLYPGADDAGASSGASGA